MKSRIDWKKVVGAILLVTLVLSVIYSIIKIINAPSEGMALDESTRVKSDYVLMLVQCLLGLIVMAVPSFIEKKWMISIPNYMYILYFVFLYCAIYLGEVRNFYFVIPHWDTILHAFSGAMLGALGFSLVSTLNGSKRLKLNLSPFFVSLFAFCFALAAGTIWEIYEYTFDGLLSLNMQKFALEDGTLLVGRDALADTMKDLVVDALSALIISIIGFFTIKKDRLAKD
ncbi:MAG: hypothetical protein GX054_10810, partial [Clostridiales bacterium]|nr:hypothetical protein [Clostridiales bacterium]